MLQNLSTYSLKIVTKGVWMFSQVYVLKKKKKMSLILNENINFYLVSYFFYILKPGQLRILEHSVQT